MPTDTFPITANGNDGHGRRDAGTWAGITVGGFDDEPYIPQQTTVQKTFFSGQFYVANTYYRWDTSSLPDSAVITSANLLLHVIGTAVPDGSVADYAADFYDFGGNPSTTPEVRTCRGPSAGEGF